jgi:sarcosine oxidase delta subunit
VVYANSPLGRYTSLVLSSYVLYRLNSSSSLTSFTAPFRAQKAFDEVRERHTSDPSLETYTSTVYGWRMFIGLCLTTPTIHGNLCITLAISTRRRFTVKMPKGGKKGYLYIRRKGLKHAAWLSVHGSGRQRKLAAEFVKYILQRAEKAGKEVYEKAKKIIEEGMSR